MSNTSLITLIIVTGALLSLNPSTIAIFSALLAGSLGKGHSKVERHGVALSFLLASFFMYTIFGSLLIIFFNLFSHRALLNLSLVIAIVGVLWGLVNIKDYYWYGKHRDISVRLAKTLHNRTVKKNDPISASMLGLIAAYAALPNIGIPLISFAAIITLIRPYNTNLMLLLACMLILPLVIIFMVSLNGLKLSSVLKWKEDSKGVFRLCIGLTTIFLGWILFLILNGSIAVPV